jgi:hypothetical protein
MHSVEPVLPGSASFGCCFASNMLFRLLKFNMFEEIKSIFNFFETIFYNNLSISLFSFFTVGCQSECSTSNVNVQLHRANGSRFAPHCVFLDVHCYSTLSVLEQSVGAIGVKTEQQNIKSTTNILQLRSADLLVTPSNDFK